MYKKSVAEVTAHIQLRYRFINVLVTYLPLLSARALIHKVRAYIHRQDNRRDRGRLVPQTFRLGTTMYWSPTSWP